MKHAVLLFFREDADPALRDQFVEEVPALLAAGPFLSVECGESVGVTISSADWGFIAEIDGPDRVREWIECEAHQRMEQLTSHLLERVASLQLR